MVTCTHACFLLLIPKDAISYYLVCRDFDLGAAKSIQVSWVGG